MNKVDINITDPEWERWVAEMYLCVRKYDCSIPDNVLEQMRYILKQYAPVEDKPVYESKFRPTKERLQEVADGCAEELVNNWPDKDKIFNKWE